MKTSVLCVQSVLDEVEIHLGLKNSLKCLSIPPPFAQATYFAMLRDMQDKGCSYFKPDGSKCGGFAVSNSNLCFVHDPDSRESFLEASSKGGKNKGHLPLPEIQIESVSDLRKLIATTINEVRSGACSPQLANCIGYLAGNLAKLFGESVEGESTQNTLAPLSNDDLIKLVKLSMKVTG